MLTPIFLARNGDCGRSQIAEQRASVQTTHGGRLHGEDSFYAGNAASFQLGRVLAQLRELHKYIRSDDMNTEGLNTKAIYTLEMHPGDVKLATRPWRTRFLSRLFRAS